MPDLQLPSKRAVIFHPAGDGWVTRLFVWIIWAAIFAGTLAFVWHYGSDVPYWDEWNMVEVLAGERPVTIEWLWSSHNGHRIPVPRLLLLGLYAVTGADFRVGMYFNVVALAGAAAVLMWASRRVRGRVATVDFIFPLLLLNWGNYENLLWTWQVTQVYPVVVVCGVLAIAAVYGIRLPVWMAVPVGVSVITLPLSGVAGLAYAAALAAWLAVAGISYYRSWDPSLKWWAGVLWTAAVMTLVLTGLYFYGYSNPTGPPAPTFSFYGLVGHSFHALVSGALFVTGGLGISTTEHLWPTPAAITLAITLLILLPTVSGLAWVALYERPPGRALALLLFVGGTVCLAASFGVGRTGASLFSRYCLLAVPMFCAAFLACPVTLPYKTAKWAQVGLAAIVVLLTPLNFRAGLTYARDYHARMESFRADLLGGASPEQLVARHVASLCPNPWQAPPVGIRQEWRKLRPSRFPISDAVSFHTWIADLMRMLHHAGIGDFRQMRIDNPPVRELVPGPQTGFMISRTDQQTDRPRAAGGPIPLSPEDAAVLLTAQQPIYVSGIKVRRPADSPQTPQAPTYKKEGWVQVFWRAKGEPAFMGPNRYIFYWSPGQDEQIIWIFRSVEQIAFHSGDPHVQRRLGPEELYISLLVPDTLIGRSRPR